MSPPQARKIIVAVDRSEGGQYAFSWALDKVIRPSDSLVIVNVRATVLDLFQQDVFYGEAEEVTALDKKLMLESEELLTRLHEEAATRNVSPVDYVMLEGDPRDAIVGETMKQGADILVLGSRGLSAIARMFLGSVSDYCVHHAPCPVIIVKKPEAAVPSSQA
eukprot:TRINITY_DN9549_c0_g1_i5.p1 TRINITY_DN9549_c0_g1~~TRINITY_DN9549_c0_g1_i5.p1  ORF type:complete len:163 (+),score=46.50 TRINITY_DN9549_c0_g1_i5:155-643(+)